MSKKGFFKLKYHYCIQEKCVVILNTNIIKIWKKKQAKTKKISPILKKKAIMALAVFYGKLSKSFCGR